MHQTNHRNKDDQRRFSKWLSIRKPIFSQKSFSFSHSCFERIKQQCSECSIQSLLDFLENECYFILNTFSFIIQLALTLSLSPTTYLRLALEGIMIVLNILAILYRILNKSPHNNHSEDPQIEDKNKINRQMQLWLSILIILNCIAAVEIEFQKTIVNDLSENLFTLTLYSNGNTSMKGITNYSTTFLFSLVLIPHSFREIDSQRLLPLQFLGFSYFQLRYQTTLDQLNGWQISFSVLLWISVMDRKSFWIKLFQSYQDGQLQQQIKGGIINNLKSFYNNVFELMPQGIAIIDSEKDLVFNNKAIQSLMDCSSQDIVNNIIGIVLKRKKDENEDKQGTEQSQTQKKIFPLPTKSSEKKIILKDTHYESSLSSSIKKIKKGSSKMQRINKGFELQNKTGEVDGSYNIEQIIDELLSFGKHQKFDNNNLLKKLHTVISESTAKSTQMKNEDQNIIFSNDSIIIEFKKNNKNLLLKIFLCEYSIKLDDNPQDKEDVDFAEPFILIILEDITDQIMKKELEAITQYRLKLLASISHELKTPLNASINILECLHGQTSDNIYEQYIQPALSSNKYLYNVFNDILDYSAMEAKNFCYSHSRFNLKDILNECLEIITFSASYKNLELLFQYDESIPRLIISDPSRIRQVVLNLLGNAMKFTTEGSIQLSALLQQDKSIEVSVQDTGIGICKENQAMIFNLCGRREFLQKDCKLQLNTQGAGLGLSVSSQIIKGLSTKQEIFVDSEQNKGSRFYFYLLDLPDSVLQNINFSQTQISNYQLTQTKIVDFSQTNNNITTANNIISNNNITTINNIISNNNITTINNIKSNNNINNQNNLFNLSSRSIKNIQTKMELPLLDLQERDSCNLSFGQISIDKENIQPPQELNISKFNINNFDYLENNNDYFISVEQQQLQKQEEDDNVGQSTNFKQQLHSSITIIDHNKKNIDCNSSVPTSKTSKDNKNIDNTSQQPPLTSFFGESSFSQSKQQPQQDIMVFLQHETSKSFNSLSKLQFLSSPEKNKLATIPSVNNLDGTYLDITNQSICSNGNLMDEKNIQFDLKIASKKQIQLELQDINESKFNSSDLNNISIKQINNFPSKRNSISKSTKILPFILHSEQSSQQILSLPQLHSNISNKACTCVPFLSIDDNEFNLMIMSRLIKKLGFDCEIASRGQIGIDLVKSRFVSNQCCSTYYMIFCDIDMPIKDGFQTSTEICEFLISNGLSQKQIPPIIACSALNLPDFHIQCKKSGMTQFLPKPVDKEKLSNLIFKLNSPY